MALVQPTSNQSAAGLCSSGTEIFQDFSANTIRSTWWSSRARDPLLQAPCACGARLRNELASSLGWPGSHHKNRGIHTSFTMFHNQFRAFQNQGALRDTSGHKAPTIGPGASARCSTFLAPLRAYMLFWTLMQETQLPSAASNFSKQVFPDHRSTHCPPVLCNHTEQLAESHADKLIMKL